MNKSFQLMKKSLLYPMVLAAIIAAPFKIVAQCDHCGFKGHDHPHFPPTEEGAKAYLEELKIHFSSDSLDNPDDLTTQRGATIGSWDAFERLPKKTRKIYEPVLFPFFTELAKRDPYPKVKLFALNQICDFRTISSIDRYNALISALSDANAYIRIWAAVSAINFAKRDSISWNPGAERIIREIASGVDRTSWNIRGFYSKKDFDLDSGINDSVKDKTQLIAIHGLKDIGETPINFLDSLYKNSFSADVRATTRRLKNKYQ